jgi:hypothetical protein
MIEVVETIDLCQGLHQWSAVEEQNPVPRREKVRTEQVVEVQQSLPKVST